ncbi:hypothetical protein [Synechococcus sp. UW140]|uniref:hypothetical protein n=1 Tax=Synechococcus sp. UW140 TaxID=368503 RepID=UPI003137AD68
MTSFLAATAVAVSKDDVSDFLEALPAFLPPDQASQQLLPDLLETLRAITALAEP